MDSFEKNISKLKKIVEKLESQTISLDDSLSHFEEGTKLIRDCKKQLDEYQKKISILVENEDGSAELKDFEIDE